jgi:hypothetical protein
MGKELVEQESFDTPTSGNTEALDWRIERYKEMGFDYNEAVALANSTQSSTTGGKDKNSKKVTWHTPLHWARVKRAVDNGCTHAQALEIFVNAEVN